MNDVSRRLSWNTKASRPGETASTALKRLVERPFQAFYELRRVVSLPIYRLYFAIHGVAWSSGWRVYGRPLIQRHRGSTITIGDQAHLRSWFHSNPLGVSHRVVLATWSPDARIVIGSRAGMTGTTICAQAGVTIGDDVRIGANSTIADTDFHPIDKTARLTTKQDGVARAITIGDGVFIGMNVLILKGVSVGDGAVIGAGSVVTQDVAPGSTVGGNPARVIRA